MSDLPATAAPETDTEISDDDDPKPNATPTPTPTHAAAPAERRPRPARTVFVAPPAGGGGAAGSTATGVSPQLLRAEADEEFKSKRKALAELMGDIDFARGGYKVVVTRTEPMIYKPPGSVKSYRIGGHLETYTTAVDHDLLKEKHGGGTYRIEIRMNGKYVTQTEVTVAGVPIPGEDVQAAIAADNPQQNGANGTTAIMDKVLDQQAVAAREAKEEAKELRKMVFDASASKGDSSKSMLEMFMSMNNPATIQARLDADQRRRDEEQKAEREERRLERAAIEARLHGEREERERLRKEEKDEAERIRKEEKEERERIRREDKERDEQRRKDEKEERDRQHKFEMQQLEARTKESQAFAQAQAVASKESTTLLISSLKEVGKMKEDFLVTALNNKKDPIDDFIKWKGVIDDMNGGDEDDEKPTWEKIADRIEGFAPSLMATVGMANVGKGAVQAHRQNQNQQHRRRAKPGTVVVADLPAKTAARAQAPAQAQTKAAAVANAAEKAAPAAGTSAIVAATTTDAEETTALPENPLKEFEFPDADDDLNAIFEKIVASLDWGMEQEMPVSALWDGYVSKLQENVIAVIAAQSIDMFLANMEQRVPPTWRIMSPDGKRRLRELHALIVKNVKKAR